MGYSQVAVLEGLNGQLKENSKDSGWKENEVKLVTGTVDTSALELAVGAEAGYRDEKVVFSGGNKPVYL